MIKIEKIQNILFLLSLYCLYICCFSLPFSTAVMGASAVAMAGCYLLSGQIKNFPKQIRAYPVLLWSPLLLFILLTVGVFYSEANCKESLMILKKYRELLYFPIVFSILSLAIEKQNNRQPFFYASISFFAGCVVLMSLSFVMYCDWIPSPKFGYSTLHHITHSFFVAMLGFWALQYAIKEKSKNNWKSIIFSTIFILAAINLFFVTPGRTGMAILIALTIFTALQRLRHIYATITILFIIALIFGIYRSSDNFSLQVHRVIEDVTTYTPGSSRSSIGQRFDWWQNCLSLIQKKPLLGYGTGSFRTIQERLVSGKNTKLSDNPHNEYLMIAVQTGIVGEFLFLCILTSLLLYSRRLPRQEKILLQGSVFAFAWGCVVNSFLLDSHPSHYFMIISAVLCSNKTTEK